MLLMVNVGRWELYGNCQWISEANHLGDKLTTREILTSCILGLVPPLTVITKSNGYLTIIQIKCKRAFCGR